MSRNYWILTLLLIGGSISLFVTIFLLPKTPSTTPSLKTPQNQATNPTPAPITLPISIDAPSVFSASVVYTFEGNIQKINTIPTGLELVTDISLPNLPPFIVCITCSQATQIFGNFSNGQRQVNYNMLVPGQHIRIAASYDLKTKKWTINRVSIQDRLSLPTSPRNNPNAPQ